MFIWFLVMLLGKGKIRCLPYKDPLPTDHLHEAEVEYELHWSCSQKQQRKRRLVAAIRLKRMNVFSFVQNGESFAHVLFLK